LLEDGSISFFGTVRILPLKKIREGTEGGGVKNLVLRRERRRKVSRFEDVPRKVREGGEGKKPNEDGNMQTTCLMITGPGKKNAK